MNRPRLVLLTPFVGYPFFAPLRQGMVDASQALQVDASLDGTLDGDAERLVEMARTALRDGCDGIAINMVFSGAFDSIAHDAFCRDIPLISFNVDDASPSNDRLAFVGQDMLAAGRLFGAQVADFVPHGAHVLVTAHDPGISALEDRARGMMASLEDKGLSYTSIITSTDRQTAIDRIGQALETSPEISIILATGEADTEAAGLVVETSCGRRGIAAAGFDTGGEILRLVSEGKILLTVDQQPYSQGYYTVIALTLAVQHGIRPANVDSGALVVDAVEAARRLRR